MELLREINKREINKLLSPKIKRIETRRIQMRKLRDDLEGMYITYKYDKSPLTVGEIVDWDVINDDFIRDAARDIVKHKKEFEEINKNFLNGIHKGNTVFIANDYRPRTEEYVLRYSAPRLTFKEQFFNLLPIIPGAGEKIILVNGGGSFLSELEERIYYPTMVYENLSRDFVFLKIRPEYAECYSLKYLIAYFKSVALLWYSYSIYDSVNLYKANILTKLPAPPECDKKTEVEKLVSEILDLEGKHLRDEEELKFVISKQGHDIDKTTKRLTEKIGYHNDLVGEKQLALDDIFFQLFNIDKEEISLMCRVLKGKHIFTNEKLTGP
ncbi:MAG: hypothetical protein ABFD52_01980 [Acidobacteriota bacterium]